MPLSTVVAIAGGTAIAVLGVVSAAKRAKSEITDTMMRKAAIQREVQMAVGIAKARDSLQWFGGLWATYTTLLTTAALAGAQPARVQRQCLSLAILAFLRRLEVCVLLRNHDPSICNHFPHMSWPHCCIVEGLFY